MLRKIAILLMLLNLISCYDNNRVDSWDIQKRVGTLIEAKANQCGNRPIVPLFFTQDRPPNEVEQCELDIINVRCPFKNYPWSCVRIF